MVEQKLFFTRNGEYTIWEKITSLKEEELNNILLFINSLINQNIENIEELEEKTTTIYSIYEEHIEFRSDIEERINEYFSNENRDKCGFNGSLFKINLSHTYVDLAYERLNQLKNSDDDYEIKGIETLVFLKRDENCIDVRLTSNKKNQYKNNLNEQIIHTEIRIYFKYELVLMTDYNDYTHSKKTKDKLLEKVFKALNDTYSKNKVYNLSDVKLRILLKKSKKYASKFTFDVDNCMNVNFSITDNLGDNPLQHKGLREFYDKHEISSIKIAMNSNDNKYITVDGENGKIIARTKCMEVKDIDEFIELLNEVVKYDYLNFDYKKDLKDIGMDAFVGHTAGKINIIKNIYKEIENAIIKGLGNNADIDTIEVTRNTFFYCLINRNIITNNNENNLISNSVINQLAKMFPIEKEKIKATFCYLLDLAINESDNLLEVFDEFINSSGDLNVNQI